MNRITPLILAVALFMEMMDSTVIATSLPAIAADIGAEPIELKLAMTAYLVALAIFIPISGWMADRYGARNVFRWAIFAFMIGSIACAMANSLPSFVGARFFQGMGGSMMSPLARLVLVRSTEKKDLVSAMAWLTMPALMGPVLGPPIGGFLTTFLSWHWIFWINIPIGAAGIVAATIFLPRTGYRAQTKLDWIGFILVGVCFSGILFGLSVISLPALPPIVGIMAVVIGTVSGILFVRHAKRSEQPLFNLKILSNPMFRISLIGGSVFRTGYGAMPFLLPLMLQIGFGLTPFEAGSIIFVAAVGAIAAKMVAQRFFAALGFRTLLIITSVLSAVLLAINGTFSPETSVIFIMTILFLSGFVRSIFFTGANALAYSELSTEDAGDATGMMAVSVQLSFALGVALAGGILEITTFVRNDDLSLVDFQIAFWVLSALSLLAIIPFMRMKSDAGSVVSGHHTGGDS